MIPHDTVVIGGGPAGSTVGSLLKKYAPELSVLILEREVFPRDHVGESQLPVVSTILHEMEAWDKVEAAGFPIKVGATYRWGASPDLWHFNFLAHGGLKSEPRPAKYRGQRRATAFRSTARSTTRSCSTTRRAWDARCGRARRSSRSSATATE